MESAMDVSDRPRPDSRLNAVGLAPARTAILCIGMLAFGACSSAKAKAKDGPRPVKEFPVEQLAATSAVVHKVYPTSLEGIQTIALRPRVSGYLTAIEVDEGAQVEEGQTLFRINSDELRQQVSSARANIEVANAAVETARLEVENKRPLVEKKIVSAYTLQAAEQSMQSAKAKLSQARTELRNAQTNLNYSVVKSPTKGVIGTIPYRVGSLVGSESPEPLTFIADIHKVRAYFSVNEKDYLRYFRSKTDAADAKKQEVRLVLADGQLYPLPGVVDAVSGLVDASTGTLMVRATFDNPERLLRSGGSGKIKLPSSLENVLLVPQAATFEIQDKRFIYVVDAENKVKSQPITAVPTDDGKEFIVSAGLVPGDTIVTDGISSLSDGAAIKPIAKSQDAEHSAPAAPAAE